MFDVVCWFSSPSSDKSDVSWKSAFSQVSFEILRPCENAKIIEPKPEMADFWTLGSESEESVTRPGSILVPTKSYVPVESKNDKKNKLFSPDVWQIQYLLIRSAQKLFD